MKNTKKLKQVLVTSTLLLGTLMIGSTSSQAVLQSNSVTHNAGKIANGASWITSIRQMEASGQTMGLNEIVDTSTCLASTDSNNIDVHMIRSTEYGAVAILSASGFGYSGEIQSAPIKSTTGNVTGIYIGTKWELVAGVCTDEVVGKDKRYYDLYVKNDMNSEKVGDALGKNYGCYGWHSAAYR